jgi:hypothetical protein
MPDEGDWDPRRTGYVFLPGTDIGGPVHEGSPCIVCHKPVEPGTGAQAMPPLPALHTVCLRSIKPKTPPSL